MDCNEVQKVIDLGLGESSGEIGLDIKSHIENCEICGAYFEESVILQNVLSKQKFEIMPDELNDITFDNIVRASEKSVKKTGLIESRFSLRWAWVPAAALAVFLVFAILPNVVNDNVNEDIRIIDWRPYSFIFSSEELDSADFANLLGDGSDLESLAEELTYDTEIDDLLESLTDEEFELLNERLSIINGGSG